MDQQHLLGNNSSDQTQSLIWGPDMSHAIIVTQWMLPETEVYCQGDHKSDDGDQVTCEITKFETRF